jgi:primosomal protein N' (replication factor Y)
MVSKGLDFDNVTLVGVLNADSMLNFPDFRAFERSYQLMSQVAGRAGRKQKRGKVIIQTGDPNHWIIQKVMYHDYINMYKQELLERKNFNYPPFYKLINITLKHKDLNKVKLASAELGKTLRRPLGNRVLGPEQPMIGRIRNLYLEQISIKFERQASAKKVKQLIQESVDQFYSNPNFKSIRIAIDVDPA